MQGPTCHRSVYFRVMCFSFLCFLVALEQIVMTFGALETGLKFDDFHVYSVEGRVQVIHMFHGNFLLGSVQQAFIKIYSAHY